MSEQPDWITRGKSIRALIKELQSFDDQDMEVRISVDGGETHKCISLVAKQENRAVLQNCEHVPGSPE